MGHLHVGQDQVEARVLAPGGRIQGIGLDDRGALGEPQAQDKLIYARPERPEQGFSAEVSSDGKTLVVSVWKGTDPRYEVVLIDIEHFAAAPVEIVSGFKHDYTYIATAGGRHFFFTDDGAPKGKGVATPARLQAPVWSEIVPESEHVLSEASIVGGRLFANYMEDVKSAVRMLALDGSPLGEVALPGIGTASSRRM